MNVSSSPLNKATVDCWGEDDGTKENQVDTYKVKHWATLSASVSSCAMLLVIRHKGFLGYLLESWNLVNVSLSWKFVTTSIMVDISCKIVINVE